MILKDVRVRYAPGMQDGIRKNVELNSGLTFVVGPNASGKSTLARAMRLALWPQSDPPPIGAELTIADAAQREHHVVIQGGQVQPHALLDTTASHRANLYRLGLKDLLRVDNRADREFAKRLQTELYGGVPVAELRSSLEERTKEGYTARRDLRSARSNLRDAEQKSRAHQNDEKDLQELRAARDDALQAKNVVNALTRLLTAVEVAQEKRHLDTAWHQLPEALDQLRADDLETKRSLEQRVREATQAYEAKRNALRELERSAQDFDPAWRQLQKHILEDGGERYAAYETCQQEAESKEALRLQKSEQLRAARANILGEYVDAPVTQDDKDALKQLLTNLHDAQMEAQALQEIQGTLDAVEAQPKDQEPKLQERISALRKWLQSSNAHAHGAANHLLIIGVLILLLAAVATTYWWWNDLDGPMTWHLGVVIALWLLVVLNGIVIFRQNAANRAAKTRREALQQQVSASGGALTDWTMERAVQELTQCEQALQRVQRATYTQSLRDTYAQRQQRADQMVRETTAALTQRLDAIGLSADALTLDVAETFLRAEKWLDAEKIYAQAHADYLHAVTRRDAAEADWTAWLKQTDLQSFAEQSRPHTLLKHAETQVHELTALRQEIVHAKNALEREQHAMDEADAALEEFKQRLGDWYDSEANLEHALVQLERRQDLKIKRESADNSFAKVCEDVQEITPLLPTNGVLKPLQQTFDLETALALPVEAIHRYLDDYQERADGYESHVEELSALEAKLRSAQTAHTMEEAYAALVLAEEHSRAYAQSRADALLEQLVLDQSVSQDETTAHPEEGENALTEANRWLQRFTHGQYELRVSPEGELLGFAVEENQPRALAALSDATRVQALLAARLAAIQRLEAGGPPLPLILDEVFSTTDPVRFEAIARALSVLVQSGRQVVYLTADPGEWRRWNALQDRHADVVQAHVQYLGVTETPRVLEVEWTESPLRPQPESSDVSHWAQALDIDAPTPHHAAESWPLLWVLSDDLPSVYRAYTQRVENAGPALKLARSLGHERFWHRADAEQISARLERRMRMLNGALTRWRKGQPGVLRWQTVLDSDAVTEAFEERVYEVFEQTKPDPVRFVEVLADVPRYRQRAYEQMQEYLEARGVLPTEAPADRDALQDAAFARVDRAQCDAADVAWSQTLIATLLPSKAEA